MSTDGRQQALRQVAEWPVAAAAVAVRSRDDVRAGARVVSVGELDRSFAWASVTKLLTTLAALDGVVRGLLDLDEPAGPPGSTVRHLLAHASGLGPDGRAVLAPPGRRRIYANRGIELVADLIASRSGVAFPDLLRERVLAPLGLHRTQLKGSAAAGAVGPLEDLVALADELLAPSLLDPDLLEVATSTVFPGLPGVLPGFGRYDECDWGLGFEVRGSKQPHWTGACCSPRTFGHFGRSGSFLWVDPDAGVACLGLADREFGDWAAQAWPRLADDVLASSGAG